MTMVYMPGSLREYLIIGLLLSVSCLGCGPSGGSGEGDPPKAQKQQLNVSIMLDLSDRIDPAVHPAEPPHSERDISAVTAVARFFKGNMRDIGALFVKGKIRVLFDPTPSDPRINDLAASMDLDLGPMLPVQKKAVFDSLDYRFERGLRGIYDAAIKEKHYPGADIWRFLNSDRVLDYCIERSDEINYRNILVIVTDGYLYHEQSTERQDNKTAYVTGPLLTSEGFRDNPNWERKFDEGGYGILTRGNDLSNLEILVLEISPAEGHRGDEDIIRKYWESWFDALKVRRYKIVASDLPSRVAPVIKDFLAGA